MQILTIVARLVGSRCSSITCADEGPPQARHDAENRSGDQRQTRISFNFHFFDFVVNETVLIKMIL